MLESWSMESIIPICVTFLVVVIVLSCCWGIWTTIVEGLHQVAQDSLDRPFIGIARAVCIGACIVKWFAQPNQIPPLCSATSSSGAPIAEYGQFLVWCAPFVMFFQPMVCSILLLIGLSLVLFSGCLAPTIVYYLFTGTALLVLGEGYYYHHKNKANKED